MLRITRLLVFVVVVALVAGCGSDGSESAETGTSLDSAGDGDTSETVADTSADADEDAAGSDSLPTFSDESEGVSDAFIAWTGRLDQVDQEVFDGALAYQFDGAGLTSSDLSDLVFSRCGEYEAIADNPSAVIAEATDDIGDIQATLLADVDNPAARTGLAQILIVSLLIDPEICTDLGGPGIPAETREAAAVAMVDTQEPELAGALRSAFFGG